MKWLRILFLLPALAQAQTWYNQTDVLSNNVVTLTNKTIDCTANTCNNFPGAANTQYVKCTNGASGSADAALLSAAATVGGNITLVADCTVNATTTLNSNTLFDGNGHTITAAAAANWSGGTLTASAFHAANNASTISIINTNFSWTGSNGTKQLIVFPSGNSNILVQGNTAQLNGMGDFVAYIGTTDFQTIGNKAFGCSNACYDHWFGATDGIEIGNIASIQTSAANAYGFLWTGFDTSLNPTITQYYKVIGNTIYLSSANHLGVWLQGYTGSCTGAAADYDTVSNNTFINAAGTQAEAVRMTDCANNAEISGNIIIGDGATTASRPAIEIGSTPTGAMVHNNIAYGYLGQTVGSDAGVFTNKGAGGSLLFNECLGTCSSLLLGNNNAASVQIFGNDTGTGAMSFSSSAGGTGALTISNTGNLGGNRTVELLDANLTAGNKVNYHLGQSLNTGDAIQEEFSYTGNNNGANYWGISMFGVGNDFLKWIYSPDQLILGDGGLVTTKGSFTITGTTFTVASGTGTCAATGSLVGGTQAGHFQCTTAGTAASTVTLTLIATSHSYTCWGRDITTPTTVTQTGALSTTAVTLTLTSVASNDVIEFGCLGY